ncbi:MAG: hypothetical protein ABI596_00910 [Pyrinomonadaceae bacterium]
MQTACTILSFVLLIAASVALWRDNVDAAFVIATLGALVWFIGFRIGVARLNSASKATETGDEDSDNSYEE